MNKDKSKKTKKQNLPKLSPKPNESPGLVYVPSVESYITLGLQEAHSAEGQMQIAELSSNCSGILADVFALQLFQAQVIDRATQTDWTWVKMAIRWRHAKLLAPSKVEEKEPAAKRQLETGLGKTAKKFLDKLKSPRQGGADTESTTTDGGAGSGTEGATSRDKADTESATSKDNAETEAVTTKGTLEVLRSEESSRSSSLQLLPDLPVREQQKMPKPHRRSLRLHKKVKLLRKGTDLPEVAENDKCVDTVDLEFDPYDLNLMYTPVSDKLSIWLNKTDRIAMSDRISFKSKGSSKSSTTATSVSSDRSLHSEQQPEE